MNYKNLLIIFFFTFLVGCEQYKPNKQITNQNALNKYKNSHILFSPSAASFDKFKNFEDRGHYFNFLIKKTKFIKKINV